MTENAPPPRAPAFHIARAEGADAGVATRQALAEEVAAEFGPRDECAFALNAEDEGGGWIGGINGLVHWRWLYVAQFFVARGWRGRGLGRALLSEAEALAREKDCLGLYLDTFSPSALAFYQANGFVVVGRIDNFPPGAARTFLAKAITRQASPDLPARGRP